MTIPGALTAALAADLKPRDEELDLYGLTHQGLVRRENQDHFLIGTLHRELAVHGTSLPAMNQQLLRGERFATFAVVADGVGGSSGGAVASQRAVETIAHYGSKDLLLSGWLEGEDVIAGRAAVVQAAIGTGRVILFGFPVQHRGQSQATFRLLFNAIFLAP